MVRPLSIIIPHYQKQDALRKTWEELQLQFHPDDQCLIVDDHSPGGVPDFDCPCTETIKPKKHTPHIYRLNTIRNYGVEHAKHDAILILDPDCEPNPRLLDYARKMFDQSVLFGGCIDKVQEDGSIIKDTRRNSDQSYWCDLKDTGGSVIWGGIMMFSKSRAKTVGWFNEDYNGAWGMAEHDFAAKCYHSGMRLRYSMELSVVHQWHPKNTDGYKRNRDMWLANRNTYRDYLGTFTPYNPAVAVLIVSLMRPYYIDQVVRAVFRNPMPIKVRLVNNGDQSEKQRREMAHWSKRWAVDYVNYQSRRLLANIRSDAIRDFNQKGYKYLILIDDDITPITNSLVNLVSEMETHPQYHALSGYVIDGKRKRSIGGKIKNDKHFYYIPTKTETRPADYTSSGFTIIRLNTVVPYSSDWEMGWNDWDWSNEVRKRGLQIGVTGKAGAYHRQLFTSKGRVQKQDSPEYNQMRYDKDRHIIMAQKFKDKWGYTPTPARPITEMPT